MQRRDEARDFVIYGRPDDPYVQELQAHLNDRGMPFDLYNVDEDDDAMQFAALQSPGNDVEPTIVIGPDDAKEILIRPSFDEVDRILDRLGYRDPRQNLEGRDGDPRRF